MLRFGLFIFSLFSFMRKRARKERIREIETLSGNEAANGGGAISAKSDFDFSTLVEIRNSTIVGNTPANLYLHNDNEGGETTAILADSPVGNYGGPTPTIALRTSSPAIDAGNCSGNSITTDQRGVARPQGEGCDIGAFESEVRSIIYLPLVVR